MSRYVARYKALYRFYTDDPGNVEEQRAVRLYVAWWTNKCQQRFIANLGHTDNGRRYHNHRCPRRRQRALRCPCRRRRFVWPPVPYDEASWHPARFDKLATDVRKLKPRTASQGGTPKKKTSDRQHRTSRAGPTKFSPGGLVHPVLMRNLSFGTALGHCVFVAGARAIDEPGPSNSRMAHRFVAEAVSVTYLSTNLTLFT